MQLIDLLRKHNVPSVVIGGHAVIFHGFVRATEDTDIVFLRNPQSELALFSALQEINAQWISDEVDPQTGIERTQPVSIEYIQSCRLMMLVTDQGFLDLFDFVPGYPSAEVSELFSTAVESHGRRFASLNWLRKMKLASGRPKDQLDLDNLPQQYNDQTDEAAPR